MKVKVWSLALVSAIALGAIPALGPADAKAQGFSFSYGRGPWGGSAWGFNVGGGYPYGYGPAFGPAFGPFVQPVPIVRPVVPVVTVVRPVVPIAQPVYPVFTPGYAYSPYAGYPYGGWGVPAWGFGYRRFGPW